MMQHIEHPLTSFSDEDPSINQLDIPMSSSPNDTLDIRNQSDTSMPFFLENIAVFSRQEGPFSSTGFEITSQLDTPMAFNDILSNPNQFHISDLLFSDGGAVAMAQPSKPPIIFSSGAPITVNQQDDPMTQTTTQISNPVSLPRNAVEWNRCKEDIYRIYILENNTLNKTMELISRIHGIRSRYVPIYMHSTYIH